MTMKNITITLFILVTYIISLNLHSSSFVNGATPSIQNDDYSNEIDLNDDDDLVPLNGYFEASVFPRTNAYNDLTQHDVWDQHERRRQEEGDEIFVDGLIEASVIAGSPPMKEVLDDKYNENLVWIASDPNKKRDRDGWANSHDSEQDNQFSRQYYHAYAGHKATQEDSEATHSDGSNNSYRRTKRMSTMDFHAPAKSYQPLSNRERFQARFNH